MNQTTVHTTLPYLVHIALYILRLSNKLTYIKEEDYITDAVK